MKVKLLCPPRLNDNDMHQFMPRLGLGLLYSYLKSNGIDVDQDDLAIRCFNNKSFLRKKINLKVFNNEARLEKYLKGRHDAYLESVIDKIIKLIDHSKYDVIGFSIIEMYQYFVSLCLSKRLKQICRKSGKRLYIVFGGPSITLKKEFTLKNYDFIDFEIFSDGEESFLQLIKYLEKNKSAANNNNNNNNIDLDSIPNLSYREGPKIQSTTTIEITRDKIPAPSFEGLPMNLYRKKDVLILPYNFTRGCIAKCAFCTHRALSKLLRVKKIDTAIKEIKSLSEKHNSKYFMFCENSINISNRFIRELCDSIKDSDLDIMWMTWARPDELTSELIRDMRKAGCIKLDFGIESGSQKVLDLINKNIGINDMQKVIRETSNAGIWVHGSFIVNLPNEEDCEFKETIDFINRNKEYLDSVDISIFSLNQGSYVSLNPEDYGIDKIKPTIGAGLGMSYSTKTKDIDAVYSVGFNRLVELRNVRFQNKISKIIDPADIFKAFSKFNGKEEAKKYLKQEKKYPKLI